jgi:threonine synthase
VRELCSRCGRIWPFSEGWRWRCACGGLLDLTGPLEVAPVDLGLSVTPLTSVVEGCWVKADYETPTGSFKDRGTATMIGLAVAAGARSVVCDSSGNAGRSVAAHAEAAGVDCTVFVPSGTAEDKMSAMALFGAEVVEVPGGRAAAARAAQSVVDSEGHWYASHVHQPAFHHGVAGLADELAVQLPEVCDAAVVVPAGNGTLVLGLWVGFSSLVASGLLERVPRIVAVQAAVCAPLAGLEPAGPTAATGIAIASPPRGPQVTAAAAASGGRIVTVAEESIAAARVDLAARGFDVEPTGAVAWAGADLIEPPAVAVLTGRAV